MLDTTVDRPVDQSHFECNKCLPESHLKRKRYTSISHKLLKTLSVRVRVSNVNRQLGQTIRIVSEKRSSRGDAMRLRIDQTVSIVEAERDALLAAAPDKATPAAAAMLLDIKGVGPEFAGVLWSEGLFRSFDNRRQVAAYAGLAPTPWQSGTIDREQGVSKSGNPRLRTAMVQLAWLWLRHQPRSALTLWFHERAERNGGRLRKATIVALARKLLVALWKYVTAGVVIEGATMKAV